MNNEFRKEEYSEKRKIYLAQSIDDLLNLLSSENLQTRFFAEMALRDLSGT